MTDFQIRNSELVAHFLKTVKDEDAEIVFCLALARDGTIITGCVGDQQLSLEEKRTHIIKLLNAYAHWFQDPATSIVDGGNINESA